MKKLLFVILILTLTPLVLFAAPDKTQERIDYEVFKAKTEANIESLKSIKSQELTKFEVELNAQKALTDQINHQIDAFGNNLTIGSTIVTVLLLLMGFFAYKNAKTDAQNTAREVMQSEVKTWFDKNANDLTQEIEKLRQKLKKLEEEASATAANTKTEIEKLLSEVVSKGVDANITVITEEEKNALNAKIEELKSIAEAMYRFEDWNTKAFAAYHRGDFINAANFWDNAAKSTDATDVQKARSLFNKGIMQGGHIEPKQPEAAIATYDTLIQRFGNSKHVAVQEQVARAHLDKGITLGELEQSDAAIATYDELIQRFGNSKHVAVQEQVARAYLNKAMIQGKHFKQLNAEIATYNTLIQHFGTSKHTSIQERVARAYINKAVSQGELELHDAAIATYDTLIQRFGNSEHVAVLELVARAYLNKGVTQGKRLKQPDVEIATYDELIQRFGNSEHAAVLERVALAYNSKGFSHLMNAKQIWKTKTARELQLNAALKCFNKAISFCATNDKGMVLGNITYTNWLLGIKKDTEQQLTEALTIGGKKLYDGTLNDTETHPVAPDKTFKVLLNKIWQTIPQDKSDS